MLQSQDSENDPSTGMKTTHTMAVECALHAHQGTFMRSAPTCQFHAL